MCVLVRHFVDDLVADLALDRDLGSDNGQWFPCFGRHLILPHERRHLPLSAEGEWSLVFFNREYSHSVLKRPKAGDFRVQADFGGSFEAAAPPAGLVSVAQRILDCVDGPLLYARVDGVQRDGALLLMELELVEPQLFFLDDPGSSERFARAALGHLA